MSTELQKQVQTLKSKLIQIEPIQKGRPSLFLTFKEAASIDIEDIYESALQGLATLEQCDNRLTGFKYTLLHTSSIQLRRELKRIDENNEINDQIMKLLKILVLYIDRKESHQILEYLIRRYRINELNIDEFITSLLPIHESKVRRISILLFLSSLFFVVIIYFFYKTMYIFLIY
jgi:U3 small nucleolar RNA-associated protein 10